MRKEARQLVFGGQRHEAVEKFFRFTRKDGTASSRGGARAASRAAKEVQLELFESRR